jgi:hypothetical protein
MTLADAERAAGVVFDVSGDSAFYPTKMPAGDAYGVLNANDNGRVNCFGVGGAAGLKQTVVTPEGFRLGNSLAQLKSIYGARLVYMPEPPHGMEPRAGYVVDEPGGRLVFIVDKGSVDSIVGGSSGVDGKPLTPSTCIF